MSDEEVVDRWVENPYWQKFCGEVYFQHKPPIDPSSMTRYRKRIGESGCELILQLTVTVGVTCKVVKPSHLKRVTVDTTVQEKAVSFPTDSRLLNRSRERLVRLCRKHAVVLRQSYARKGPKAVTQSEQICPCPAISSNASRSQNTANLFGTCGSRYRTQDCVRPHTIRAVC